MRRKILRAALILSSVLLLTACGSKAEEIELEEVVQEEVVEEEKREETTDSETAEWIYIHVCGHVLNPGVYKLPQESRIFEAIEAAGGITEEAQESAMNLAEVLTDGQQIYIPSKEEWKESEEQTETAHQDDGKVNLNSASAEELMTLSGIGQAKADAIIQYREEHGGFQNIEELKEVTGIKDGVFQKVKDQIKTE